MGGQECGAGRRPAITTPLVLVLVLMLVQVQVLPHRGAPPQGARLTRAAGHHVLAKDVGIQGAVGRGDAHLPCNRLRVLWPAQSQSLQVVARQRRGPERRRARRAPKHSTSQQAGWQAGM